MTDTNLHTRYIKMDVTNIKEQDIVLDLCQQNDFYYDEVSVHLRGKMSAGHLASLLKTDLTCTEEFYKVEIQRTRLTWELHGLVAIDASITKQNPDGKDKTVGFLLYQVHRETKQELKIIFLLVAKSYRGKSHAKNMVKLCENMHLFKTVKIPEELTKLIESMKQRAGNQRAFDMLDNWRNIEEKCCGHLQSDSGEDLVNFFTILIDSKSSVIPFYKKLGFQDKSSEPGWRDIMPARYDGLVSLIKAGRRTDTKILGGAYMVSE
jgi:GNAT superfamily N-acetyltransferase